MAPKPGPLCDLPLERFIDVPSVPVPTTSRRTHKRPLSPGTPNLFSPTKRRILVQEGVFSPEKTIKSSIVPVDRALVLHDVLMESPACKLDFGQSPRSDRKVASTSRLFQNCFQEPAPEHFRQSHRHDRDHSLLLNPNASSSRLLSVPSSSSNHQTNIHYPDFDVWIDHDPNPSSLSCHSSNDFHDSDEDKENSHPKTKWRTGLSRQLKRVSFASPDQRRRPNTSNIPFTPLNARSSFGARALCELTPGKALKVDRDEMRRRRELLAMELDGDDDSDDDL